MQETTILNHQHQGQTLAEEIANAITHGIGAALSVAGLTLLVVLAAVHGDPWRIVSFSIYGGALVFLYLASTLYHSFQHKPVKQLFHIFDHVGIFFLIAGTYTPFLLVKMRDATGWTFLGIVWGLALLGASIKIFYTGRFTVLSTIFYVALGWLAVFMLKPMSLALGQGALVWILAGGLSYTIGTIPFLWTKLPYNHAIWHLFVIGGSVCHFFAMVLHVLPMQ